MNSNFTAHKILVAALAVIASTFFVVAGPASSASAAKSAAEIQAMSPSTYEQRVQKWVNKVRTDRGKRKLRFQACTDYYSQRWSQHLADSGKFYHQDLSPFFDHCGARYAGETLARGTATPRAMVKAWMKSTGHRRVMLSKKPRRIGIAAVLDGDGRWVLTANFTRF
jgi:uncharacterized protein YkwD